MSLTLLREDMLASGAYREDEFTTRNACKLLPFLLDPKKGNQEKL